MGGVVNSLKKTTSLVTDSAKKIASGKANWRDHLNVMDGGLTKQLDDSYIHKQADWQPPDDPLAFDPNQAASDQSAIEGEGNRQYQQNLDQINQSGTAETQRAKDLFGQMLPDIAENSQAAHLYDSTGYGQEVGRQQANIASQVAENEAGQRNAALASRQGFQTGALQRGMSLEDFASQARVAKAIGAQMAPQAPSSKATGTSGALAGAGTGATVGTGILPGWGTAIGAVGGGIAGYAGGASANKKGGK